MKNLKKTIAMVLVIALCCAVSVGLTVAYLTDRDSVANVFTVGDVEIKLDEAFDQGSNLVPGVVIQKEPTITNTGDNDAWVWATIAIPAELDNDDASKNVIHFNYDKDYVNDTMWTWTDDQGWMISEMEIEGVMYNVYTVLYQTALVPGAVTEPVMTRVYMDTNVDIDPNGDWYVVENGNTTKLEWNSEEDGSPVIYVSAYAIQAEGFATVQEAYAAYQAQWGDNGVEIAPIVIDLAEEKVDNEETFVYEGNRVVEDGTLNVTTDALYGTYTPAGSSTTFNDVDLVTKGGGVNVWGTAVWNGGDITTNSMSTSGRHVFYVADQGHLTINGGEFTFSPTNLTRKGYYLCAHGAGAEIIVNGGIFNKPSTRSDYAAGICEMEGGTVIIYGGEFAFDPSAWVAEGYEAVLADGWWTVQAAN